MYQWKIEDQQNLGMSTYRLPEILIRLKCSARCLPSWKPKHCPSTSSSTLQNPATVYNFNSRVIFKHLKACLHIANNKRLGENARVTRSCLVFFNAFILTNNLVKFVEEKVKVCYGLTTRLVNSAEVDLITMSGVPRRTIEDCFFL